MNNIKDGGPAFPNTHTLPKSNDPGWHGREGMSLRDWFAGMALQGMMVRGFFPNLAGLPKEIPFPYQEAAYIMADEMLAEREKNP